MTSTRETVSSAGQLSLFDLQWLGEMPIGRAPGRRIAVPKREWRDHRDVFNARLLDGLAVVGPYDIPQIAACTAVPGSLIAFSEARGLKVPAPESWVHFYEDDYRFEQFWERPEQWIRRLRSFAGVISPDFSLYRNMPNAQQIFNTYRNQLLGARMQAEGIPVIANVRLNGRASSPHALAGAPRRSTIAIGLHGCTRARSNRRLVVEEVRIICDELAPANLVVYGGVGFGVLDYPRELGVPVHVFAPDTYTRSQFRTAAA